MRCGVNSIFFVITSSVRFDCRSQYAHTLKNLHSKPNHNFNDRNIECFIASSHMTCLLLLIIFHFYRKNFAENIHATLTTMPSSGMSAAIEFK